MPSAILQQIKKQAAIYGHSYIISFMICLRQYYNFTSNISIRYDGCRNAYKTL